jgi:uncharacterized membrane protein YebE (DUF533 family)
MDRIQGMKGLLDGLLSQGRELAQKGEDMAAERLGVGDAPDDRAAMRKTAMAGGAAAAAIGLLLGTRGGRSLAKTGVVLGGLGMLGKMAYDAYQKKTGKAPEAPPVADLTGEDADRRATAITVALIAAAKADGHIDDTERARIEGQLAGLPAEARAAMTSELMKPLSAADVAAHADSDQARAEIYAMTAMVCGGDHPGERAYLDDLAHALGLPADVARQIEADAASAA